MRNNEKRSENPSVAPASDVSAGAVILRQLQKRQRRLNIADSALKGLFYGSAAALLIVLAGIVSTPQWLQGRLWVLLLAVPAGGILGLLWGCFRRIAPLQLARAIDRAAQSQDRFASAVQLAGHHRAARVDLITADALSKIRGTNMTDALPGRFPVELKWLPLVAALLAVVLWLGPREPLTAADTADSEVSTDQWKQLNDEFRRDLKRKLTDSQLREEREIDAQLKRLASSLANQPEKRKVLQEIARMRARLQSRRQQLKTRSISMRKAASALRSSEMLKKLAELLKKGDYRKAARELKALSELLRLMKMRPTAEELESVAKDFERLARELESHDELHKACEQCASAANSLNQKELAKALKELADQLAKQHDELKKSDSLCEACDALDRFERRLAEMKQAKNCPVCQGKNSSQCSACQGAGQRFVRRRGGRKGGRKGGLKAGVGTVRNWTGGNLSKRPGQRQAVLDPVKEGDGRLTTVSKTISTREKADSALAYKRKFAELVKKAEADLALEDIPLAYRDYLRRYFSAIKPKDDENEKTTKP